MRINNPAKMPCDNIEKGPEHDWIRRADGTAYCTRCAVQLNAEDTEDAFTVSQINKKAGGK
jgi:hypothetical protein